MREPSLEKKGDALAVCIFISITSTVHLVMCVKKYAPAYYQGLFFIGMVAKLSSCCTANIILKTAVMAIARTY